MSYHMLFVRDDGVWSPAFGDYERECVARERDDCWRASAHNAPDDMRYRARDMVIVAFSRVPSQRRVNDTAIRLILERG